VSDDQKSEIAARAAWLYFIAGNTQEEIATKLQVSRPTAQRLVSLALAQRMVTFRFEHQVSTCMELSEALLERFGLKYCNVVPSDPKDTDSTAGVATSAATFIEQMLSGQTPVVMAVGTGRTLRAAVRQIQPMQAPHQTLVGLVGNVAPDGSASFFDVLGRLADRVNAPHYPLPLPVLADTDEQRDVLISLRVVENAHALARRADVTLVGIGQMDMDAPQFVDGFISREELLQQIKMGAVGEITGWSFDVEGRVLEGGVNARLTSAPLKGASRGFVVGVAIGEKKARSIISALKGQLINSLLTDEFTAKRILAAT
jgi:DNA-binding transcriptional regulator LsrR (DeoR family)